MITSPLTSRPTEDRPPPRPGPVHARVERPRTRRGRLDAPRPGALRAALLSLLWPGAGQLYAGRWHRGLAFVTVAFGLAVLAIAPVTAGPAHVAGLFVRPDVLVGVLVADVALLAFRLVAVVDAYRLARVQSRPGRAAVAWAGAARRAGPGGSPPQPARIVSLAGLVAVVAVTALPHVAVGYYDVQAQGLLSDVFPSTEETLESSGPPVDSRPTSPLLARERITVLLAGGDAGPRREGLRTDTLVVVSLALKTGEAALFSIPRNLVQVPLPPWVESPWSSQNFPDLINNLYEWAESNPQLMPPGVDPGPAVLTGAIEQMLGIPIDYHIITDLKGFVDGVDALGGVDVTVTQRIYDQLDSPDGKGEWDAIDLRPGRHHLDGRAALVYVRTRRASSDYARIDRQRCFLAALASQVDAPTLVRAFPRLAAVARRSLETDFPVEALPDLIKLATRVDVRGVATVAFTPPGYMKSWEDGYPVPDVTHIRRTVSTMLRTPPVVAGSRSTTGTRRETAIELPTWSSRSRAIPTEPPPGPRTIADTCG